MKTILKLKVSLLLSLAILNFNCLDDDGGVGGDADAFDVFTLQTKATPSDSNPEIVRMVPGTDDEAVFVASEAGTITMIEYSSTSFDFGSTITLSATSTQEFTSIDVHPDGEHVAVLIAEADCNKGFVRIISLESESAVGTDLEIGYNPDSASFSGDGNTLAVANEDDREDRPCKPAGRMGGTVSLIDSSDISSLSLIEEIDVDYDTDSEPEGIKIGKDNDTVLLAVQETSQYGILSLANAPGGDFEDFDIPQVYGFDANPDGLAISPDSSIGLIGNEFSDSFTLVSLPDGEELATVGLRGDVPSPPYNHDLEKDNRHLEPEEVKIVTNNDKMFAVIALQESHGVIVYDITDPSSPTFDSITEVGIAFEDDRDNDKSDIGSEGVDVHPTNGIGFVANEREGSISMIAAQWAN